MGYQRAPRAAPARVGEVRRMAFDASRARQVLGWEAQTPLGDGLRLTVAALRAGSAP
jgi:nucleoside-diphosphate-sugar epimerase